MRRRFIEPPGLGGSLGDAPAPVLAALRATRPQKKAPPGRSQNRGLRGAQASRRWCNGSVDQVLAAQGGDEIIVFPCGAAGLFSLTGQLTGGGDGHGSASLVNCRQRDRCGWRVASRGEGPLLPPRGSAQNTDPSVNDEKMVATATEAGGCLAMRFPVSSHTFVFALTLGRHLSALPRRQPSTWNGTLALPSAERTTR